MYSQSSFDASKSSTAPKGLTALLLGVIICYQIVSQIFLHQAVTHEDDAFESDAGCAAGAKGYACQEAKLFEGWHESPDELEQLLKVPPSTATTQPAPATPPSAAVPVAAAATQGPAAQQELGDDNKPGAASTAESKPSADAKPEQALEGMLWDLVWQMGGGDQSHEAPDKARKPAPVKSNAFMAKKPKQKVKRKPSAGGLMDLQTKLEAKMQVHARRHAEHRALRALSVAARSNSQEPAVKEDTMTPWAHGLDDLTHDLETQMREWRTGRAAHAQSHAKAEKTKTPYDPMTPWAHNLDDLTHEMQDHMETRNKERAEHAAAHSAAHGVPVTPSPFMNEIDALGRELCQTPDRRDTPACAQFMHPDAQALQDRHTAAKDRHDSAMAHIKLLEKHLEELEKDKEHDYEEIQNESTDFLRELCADPARHSYPTCANLLAKKSAVPPTAAGNLRSKNASASSAAESVDHSHGEAAGPHVIRWKVSDSSDAAHATQHMAASPLLMSRQELRGSHWEGKIPKVACITVLPHGQVTETLMRYFMDNYKLQHYEGEHELIFVYHDADKEAARIAHLYADGTSVKASAARGGGTPDGWPSATAYRYGAWHANDANLVVRWDFEAWHHPNRLSMQVRAIALSKRPASLVTMVSAFDADGKSTIVPGGVGPHGSMMGETAWMTKHWMPSLEEENDALHGLHSKDIVQVAMPDLLAYHDVSMLKVSPS